MVISFTHTYIASYLSSISTYLEVTEVLIASALPPIHVHISPRFQPGAMQRINYSNRRWCLPLSLTHSSQHLPTHTAETNHRHGLRLIWLSFRRRVASTQQRITLIALSTSEKWSIFAHHKRFACGHGCGFTQLKCQCRGNSNSNSNSSMAHREQKCHQR